MGKRRGNNEGSIYQVPGRGWMGTVSLGNGRRKTVSGKTRKEVADKINLLLVNQKRGCVATTPERMTVATYLTNWLRNTIEPRDTPNTYAFYESITRVHLIPGIGSIPLVKLSPANVRELLNQKRDKGLSRTTVLAIHATLKAALSEAVRDEMLYRNVAMLVRTHDAKKMKEEQQRSFKVLSAEQTAQFLNAISDHPWENFFVVSLMLGIRRAEVVALRWQNIHFEVGEIKILNSIISVRHKGTRLASLKNAGSRRSLRCRPSCVMRWYVSWSGRGSSGAWPGLDGANRIMCSRPRTATTGTRIRRRAHFRNCSRWQGCPTCGCMTCVTPARPPC
jgi:integrase